MHSSTNVPVFRIEIWLQTAFGAPWHQMWPGKSNDFVGQVSHCPKKLYQYWLSIAMVIVASLSKNHWNQQVWPPFHAHLPPQATSITTKGLSELSKWDQLVKNREWSWMDRATHQHAHTACQLYHISFSLFKLGSGFCSLQIPLQLH